LTALWMPDWQRLLRHARRGGNGRIRLGMRQVYILPTLRGWLFGALLVALGIAGTNYGNNLIFVLAFVLAGVGNAALFQTWRNLAGLELTVRAAEPVFAGQTAQVPVTLYNGHGRLRDGVRLRFGKMTAAITYVQGASLAATRVPCQTHTRGRLRPGRLTVETFFPLGMFRAWSLVEMDSAGLVFPRPQPGTGLPPEAAGDTHGGHTGTEGDDDFIGLRSYREGDPLHRVSWKTSARTEDLYAKEFGAEAASIRWLDWDRTPATDVETRLSVMAAWVLAAEREGAPWGLRMPGIVLGPATGPDHRDRCLTELALYDAAPGNGPQEAQNP